MTDVFISYAREDREQARVLAAALQAAGWTVWWDRDIKVGQAFDQIIETALDSAKSIVVLWSRNSTSSEWVRNEAASAAERGVLVPALIENVKPPLEFRRKQTADLIEWDGNITHAGFQDLCGGITAVAGFSSPPASTEVVRPPPAGFDWRRSGIVAGIAIFVAALAGAAYFGRRMDLPQSPPLSAAPRAVEAPFGAGVFEFTWPGNDCWDIYRAQERVAGPLCGSGKQALQAGPYTVKPYNSSVFVPFSILVQPNAVTSADAKGGTLDFKWPRTDCWDIYRGETKAAGPLCGSGKQALQAGTYAIKAYNAPVFVPFVVVVKRNELTTVDAMGGMLDFKWPGTDCWDIYRGETKAVNRCGAGQQALQAGAYTIRPSNDAAFKPINIHVTRGQTLIVP